MAALIRTLGRQCLLKQHHIFQYERVAMASSAYEEMRQFWDKNRKLNRPLSPFLTVYKPHLAMMTSLTHRVTGVCMQCSVALISIGLLALPGDFTHYVEIIRSWNINPLIIYSFKTVLAFPVVYHFLNGIRHLSWDAGQGFALPTLYKSGYAVMALSAIVTAYFVFGL